MLYWLLLVSLGAGVAWHAAHTRSKGAAGGKSGEGVPDTDGERAQLLLVRCDSHEIGQIASEIRQMAS